MSQLSGPWTSSSFPKTLEMMPRLSVLFVISPLALVGLPQEEDEEEGEGESQKEEEEGEGESREEKEKDDAEENDDEHSESGSSDGSFHFTVAQELEDVKFWASSSPSLRRIYLCHACDDVYGEAGFETFGRSLVVFRDFLAQEWQHARLDLGGSGYHRAVARREGSHCWGRGIKKSDRDVFDDSGLGFLDSEGDGWPLP
jgi:hypothetical protein